MRNRGLVVGALALSLVPTAAMAQASGPALTVKGVVIYDPDWRTEAIVPYRLRLDRPVRLKSDGICETKMVREMDLWTREERRYRSIAGRHITVSGHADCPRGGWVIRDISVRAASSGS